MVIAVYFVHGFGKGLCMPYVRHQAFKNLFIYFVAEPLEPTTSNP